METEENTLDKVKNFFTLHKKSYYSDSNFLINFLSPLEEKIEDFLKQTRWSSTDKNAHIS